MNLGTLVRAFDFISTDACYMEGRIAAICENTKTLTINTTKAVFPDGSSEVFPGDTFTTPMLGYSMNDELTRIDRDGNPNTRNPSRIMILREGK